MRDKFRTCPALRGFGIRISYFPSETLFGWGLANGSALECAACFDVLVARIRLTASDVRPGKSQLREIVSMLIAMKTTATIQSASLVDLAIASRSSAADHMQEELEMLRQIAAMLTSLSKAVSKDT